MKNLFTAAFLLLCSQVIAQCPNQGSFEFAEQYQLDRFLDSYSDCKEYNDQQFVIKLGVDGDPISDLSGFQSITHVSQIDIIGNESALVSLDGLRDLRSAGKVRLYRLMIQDLDFLAELETIGTLEIDNCPLLTTTDAIQGLNVTEGFSFRANESLISIGMIRVPAELKKFIVVDNPFLERIEIEGTITKVTEHFETDLWSSDILNSIESVTGFFKLLGEGDQADLTAFNNLNKVSGKLALFDIGGISDLSFFGGMDLDLTELWIHNCGVSTLDGIAFNSMGNNNEPKIFLEYNDFLTDIKVLSQFDVYEAMSLRDNLVLSDLAPLAQVDSITYLNVTKMHALSDLQGFLNLRAVSHLQIHDNKGLFDLSGLENLEKAGVIHISNNDNLVQLNALEGLGYLEHSSIVAGNGVSIRITHNESLESILGMRNAFGYAYAITVKENPLLVDCAIPLICNSIEENTIFEIVNNGSGCNSEFEVAQSCDGLLSVKIFYDQNQNGIDDNELSIPVGDFVFNNNYDLIPDNNGVMYVAPVSGINTLEFSPDPNWMVTTPSILTFDNNASGQLKIGVFPLSEIDDLQADFVSGPIVCSRSFELTVFIRNQGTSVMGTEQELNYVGELISTTAESFNDQNEQIIFDVGDIRPGETVKVTFFIEAPDVSQLDVGSLTSLELLTTSIKSGAEVSEETDTQTFEFLCSYDPNDKQVVPAGIRDEHYTLFSDGELQYNIRFQNTGNYPAEDVVIRDTLDEDLDLATFRFIGASHEMTQLRKQDNILEFRFENIYLPDSIRDLEGSNGYVSYAIAPKNGSEENTLIENTAHIYFDSNPAIVTNTVFNTMVSEIPGGTSTLDDQRTIFNIYPNPASDLIQVTGMDLSQSLRYTIYNTRGQVVKNGILDKSKIININDLTPSLYLLKLGETVEKFLVE